MCRRPLSVYALRPSRGDKPSRERRARNSQGSQRYEFKQHQNREPHLGVVHVRHGSEQVSHHESGPGRRCYTYEKPRHQSTSENSTAVTRAQDMSKLLLLAQAGNPLDILR